MENLELMALRIVQGIFFSMIIVLLIINVIFYGDAIQRTQINVRKDVTDATKVIDGDKLAKVIKNKSMHSIEYKEVQEAMIRWKNDKDVKYFYTMYKENNNVYFLVDSAILEPSILGEKYKIEEEMKQAFDGQVTYTPHPVKDTYGIFISAYAPIKDSSGQIVAIVGVDIDVKEVTYLKYKFIIDIIIIILMAIVVMLILKKSEEVLKKHKILFENAQDIILYTTEDGKIIDANKKAVTEYGYSYNELKTKNLKELRSSEYSKNLNNDKMMDNDGSVFETVNIRKDGTSFPVEISTRSITINNEKLMIRIIRDITQRKKIESEVLYLANYDSLTESYNRASLMGNFNLILEEAKKNNYKVAVILFDVDKFKTINDTYGHCAGDAILKTIANSVKQSIRSTDIFGRLGGDEFLIVQKFVKDKKDIISLIDRILENLKAQPINLRDNGSYINISIGISIFPSDGDSIEELIHYADDAMYYTKKNGGNSYNFYENSKKVLIGSLDKND